MAWITIGFWPAALDARSPPSYPGRSNPIQSKPQGTQETPGMPGCGRETICVAFENSHPIHSDSSRPWAHGPMGSWDQGRMGAMRPWDHGPKGGWGHGTIGPWDRDQIPRPGPRIRTKDLQESLWDWDQGAGIRTGTRHLDQGLGPRTKDHGSHWGQAYNS